MVFDSYIITIFFHNARYKKKKPHSRFKEKCDITMHAEGGIISEKLVCNNPTKIVTLKGIAPVTRDVQRIEGADDIDCHLEAFPLEC